MKHILSTVLFCSLMVATPSNGAPIGGAKASFKIVPGSGELTLEEEFKGGERACVIVVGDHDPVCDVGIQIFDKTTNALVAQDSGKGDYSAAIWYPARDGTYRIVIQNSATDRNKCYIAMK